MTKNKLHVIKGDRVKVIAGKDKGAVGEVLAVHPEAQRVTVSGVNIVKRHLRDTAAQPQGRQTKGGIVSSEAPIRWSSSATMASSGVVSGSSTMASSK